LQIECPKKLEGIYKEDVRYYFLKGGRGSGKSFAVADRILFHIIREPDTNTLCIREIQKSIKHSSKKLIEDRIRYHKLQSYFEITETEIKNVYGSGVMIFNGAQQHTIDSIKSLENFSLVWSEESQNLSAKSLDLLIPTIRAEGSKLFFTWNPMTRTDPIEKLSHSKKNSILIHINYDKNPFCTQVIKDEAEEMKLQDPNKYHHIFLGGYVDTTGNKLFSYKDLENAMDLPGKASGATIIGLDVARYGSDSTVLTVRSGLWVKVILEKKKLSITEVADWAGHISNIYEADAIIVDTIGLGVGVYDILVRKGYFAVDGNFGFKATNEKTYMNKRAESYFKLSEAVKRGLSIPYNENLMEELLSIEYSFNETGKAKIIPKDKIKEELGRSPDLADSLALSYFTDVLASVSREAIGQESSVPNLF